MTHILQWDKKLYIYCYLDVLFINYVISDGNTLRISYAITGHVHYFLIPNKKTTTPFILHNNKQKYRFQKFSTSKESKKNKINPIIPEL